MVAIEAMTWKDQHRHKASVPGKQTERNKKDEKTLEMNDSNSGNDNRRRLLTKLVTGSRKLDHCHHNYGLQIKEKMSKDLIEQSFAIVIVAISISYGYSCLLFFSVLHKPIDSLHQPTGETNPTSRANTTMGLDSSGFLFGKIEGVPDTLAGETDIIVVRQGIRMAVLGVDKDCSLLGSGCSSIKCMVRTTKGAERGVVACVEDHYLELGR